MGKTKCKRDDKMSKMPKYLWDVCFIIINIILTFLSFNFALISSADTFYDMAEVCIFMVYIYAFG